MIIDFSTDTLDGGVADNDTCIDNSGTNVSLECEIEFV